MKFWNDLAGWKAGDVVGTLEDEETVGEVKYTYITYAVRLLFKGSVEYTPPCSIRLVSH